MVYAFHHLLNKKIIMEGTNEKKLSYSKLATSLSSDPTKIPRHDWSTDFKHNGATL